MKDDTEEIYAILSQLRDDYVASCGPDIENPEAPITERDIVADIYNQLKSYCRKHRYHAHCEIKPASSKEAEVSELKKLPRIDVVVLADQKNTTWLSEAKALAGKYQKGSIEARFSSVPVGFFRAAIEVKIQSRFIDAKKDIDTLRSIRNLNPSCQCYFVLFNARGSAEDHERILAYAEENQITVLEYTSNRR